MGIALTLAVREPRDVPATTVIDEFALRDRSPGDEADEQSAAMWLQSGQRIADATAAAQIAHDSNVEVGCPAARSGIAAPVADVFALVGAMLQSRKAADEAEADDLHRVSEFLFNSRSGSLSATSTIAALISVNRKTITGLMHRLAASFCHLESARCLLLEQKLVAGVARAQLVHFW